MLKNKDLKSLKKRNDLYIAWSRKEALKSSLLRMTEHAEKASYAWMALPVALLLTACASPSMQPCLTPTPIQMPALTQPLPSVSYSLTAAQRIQSWQARATGTSLTSKP